jgi:exodeoxyribonuclease V alpha subunit
MDNFFKINSFIGIIDRITFSNEENGYSVIKVKPIENPKLKITVIAQRIGLAPGTTFNFHGIWIEHPKYGMQFKADKLIEEKPEGTKGLEGFLGSGLLKGIGPSTAKKIVRAFGEKTLEILDTQVERLLEIKGISPKKLTQIKKSLDGQKINREVMIFLNEHDIYGSKAIKIIKAYGKDSMKILKENPYRVSMDISGIGFLTADEMAIKLGIDRTSDLRIIGGISHLLYESRNEGHCYLTRDQILTLGNEVLGFDISPKLNFLLDKMEKTGELKVQGPCYFAKDLFESEKFIAKKIFQLQQNKIEDQKNLVNEWISLYCDRHEIKLSDEQKNSITGIIHSPLSLLTGGPGVGKTTTTKLLVTLLKAMKKSFLLAAPTGRAAQRMSEVIGESSSTIHRLLSYDPSKGGFVRDENFPLSCDFLIIDESSMLDVSLTSSLLKAVRLNTQVLFIGDPDQLPSVGPGNFLGDLLSSGKIKVFKLTQVFRQAKQSSIITFSHQINRGIKPNLQTPIEDPSIWKDEDCFFIDSDEPTKEQLMALHRLKKNGTLPPKYQAADVEKILNSNTIAEELKELLKNLHPFSTLNYNLTATEMIKKLYVESIPKYLGKTEIQILTPMIRGGLGTRNLNLLIQQSINPPGIKLEIEQGNRIFREGDRVIQKKNNYDLGVFNGDIGFIERIKNDILFLAFGTGKDIRFVEYKKDFLDDLDLAYAITIHKSQGSEFPVVIIPVSTMHYMMLFRNLFYTGLTRAKKLAIFIGNRRALAMAINNNEKSKRQTGLPEFLNEAKWDKEILAPQF